MGFITKGHVIMFRVDGDSAEQQINAEFVAFARQLERELSEAQKEIATLRRSIEVFDNSRQAHYRELALTQSQLESHKQDAERLAERLREIVEHINECDERDLLACDSDQHPPSVFSVYAGEAEEALREHEALKTV